MSLGSTPPIRRVSRRPDVSVGDEWPASVPAVRAILEHGLDLGSVTVLVGENGSGKSTIVEAVAALLGVPGGGGSNQGMFEVRPSESPLPQWLRLERSAGASRWAYFLRAETMHAQSAHPAGPCRLTTVAVRRGVSLLSNKDVGCGVRGSLGQRHSGGAPLVRVHPPPD